MAQEGVISLMLLLCLSCVLMRVTCQTGLSDSEKDAILDAHNSLRGMVSPTAANMLTMEWNDELAEVAQNYAEQCVFDHNPNRVTQQNTFQSVGENLAAGSGAADYVGFVQSWYDEVSDYSFNTNGCSRVCGHYTQVVWATSESLGCGAFRCDNLVNAGRNWVVFVCNYGPAGNFVGRLPYESGQTCSACPDEAPNCVDNLCSASSSNSGSSRPNGGTVSLIICPLVLLVAALMHY